MWLTEVHDRHPRTRSPVKCKTCSVGNPSVVSTDGKGPILPTTFVLHTKRVSQLTEEDLLGRITEVSWENLWFLDIMVLFYIRLSVLFLENNLLCKGRTVSILWSSAVTRLLSWMRTGTLDQGFERGLTPREFRRSEVLHVLTWIFLNHPSRGTTLWEHTI